MDTNPLVLVREAHLQGASTRKEIAVVTGLDQDMVELCVDLLIARKDIDVTKLKGACTIGGCSSCKEDSTCQPSLSGPTFVEIGKRPIL